MVYDIENVVAIESKEEFVCVECRGIDDYLGEKGLIIHTQESINDMDDKVVQCDKCGKIL